MIPSVKNARGILTLIILIIGFAGGIPLTFLGFYFLYREHAVSEWKATQGTVFQSKPEFINRDRFEGLVFIKERAWIPKIKYEYEVGTIRRIGERISVFDIYTHHKGPALKMTRKYPVGRKIDVYFNPSNPDDSVLEKNTHGRTVYSIILGVILITSAGTALRSAIRKRSS